MELIDDIEPHATQECVAAWQQQLPATTDQPRLLLLTTLAWHLRQRDTAAAARLSDEADAMSAIAAPDLARRIRARLALVRAEAALLFADCDAARAQVRVALDAFTHVGDDAGRSDAQVLAAAIAADLGQHADRDAALAHARALAVSAGDTLRSALIDAASAYHAAVAGSADAASDWAATMDGQIATGIPGL